MSKFPPITSKLENAEPNSPAGALPYLAELADRTAPNGKMPALQLSGSILQGAVGDFLAAPAEDFLRMTCDDKQAVLRAFATEQMIDPALLDGNIGIPDAAA
jgi:hypothetical protein